MMSFRGQHHQYSPYYQQLDAEPERQGAESISTNSYQQASYQPLSGYQHRPSQPPTPNLSNAPNAYGDLGAGNLSSAANPSTNDTRSWYKGDRSSVDTTNLGNLAYASTLSAALTASRNAFPQENSSQYGLATARPVTTEENRPTSASGQESSRRLPPTHAQYPSQSYSLNNGRNGPAQPQHALPPPSQQPSRSFSSYQRSSEQSNSRDGQGMSQPGLRNPYHSNLSPKLMPPLATSISAGQTGRGGYGQLQHTQVRTKSPVSSTANDSQPSFQAQHITAIPHENRPVADTRSLHSNAVSNFQAPGPERTPHANQKSPTTTATNLRAQVQRQRSQQPSPAVQEHHLTTVDPSQVFDDFEYRRRMNEEIEKRLTAEAARNATSNSAANIQSPQISRSEDARSQMKSPASTDIEEKVPPAAQGREGSESTIKDQMELEMKHMIEKMRDYKAKDPSLFSQIWEQVKKGQTPQAGVNSAKPPIQRSSASPPAFSGQLNSPLLSDNPNETEPSAASSFPPEFDRGRFPFQRRRRGGLVSAGYRSSKSHHKKDVSDVDQSPSQTPQVTLTEQPPASLIEKPPASLTRKPPINLTGKPRSTSTSKSPGVKAQAAIASSSEVLPHVNTQELAILSSSGAPPVANMFPSNKDDTDQRLLAAMRDFQNSLPPSNTPPTRTSLPPRNYNKPSNQAPIEPSHPLGQNAKPAVNPPKGKTHWPEDKKQALAQAAADFLHWNTPNAANSIDAKAIHELLDQNPSYTDLCNILASKGFFVERGHFARFLLNAVPDMGLSSNSPAAMATPNVAPQWQPSWSMPSKVPPPAYFPGQTFTGVNLQKQAKGQAVENSSRVHAGGQTLSSPPATAKPLTKEDKARKRNFSEIVDLSQAISDEEDFSRYSGKFRSDEKARDSSIELAKMAISRSAGSTPALVHTKKQQGQNTPKPRDHILSERVSEPMDKHRDARRCSGYDPKTVARDILIASGKHPNLAPLNHHLDVLRDRFDSVTNETNLSTFKWDIVDPLEKPPSEMPPGPESAPATLADIMSQGEDVEGTNEDIVPSTFATLLPKPTPSNRRGRPRKAPNPDTIGAPDETELGGGLKFDKIEPARDQHSTRSPMMGKFKLAGNDGNTTSFGRGGQRQVDSTMQSKSSSRSSHVDPIIRNNDYHPNLIQQFALPPVATSNGPPRSSNLLTTSPRLIQTRATPEARCFRCRKQHSKCDGQKPCSRCRSAGLGAKDCNFDIDAGVRRRGGRPPGAKNKQPRSDKGIPKGSKPSGIWSDRKVPPFVERVASRKSSEPRSAVSPAASIAIVIQQTSPSVKSSRSQHLNEEIDKGANQVYRPFKCKWDQCPAELHDSETLSKHVRRHRRGLEKPYPCKMPGCGHVDGDNGATWTSFSDEDSWDRHVAEKHIQPVTER